MGRNLNTQLSLTDLQAELNARYADQVHLSRLDAPVTSRLDLATLQAELDARQATATNLARLDAAVTSRLDLAALQSELDARSVTTSKLNNLDTTVGSRLSSTDSRLNNLDTNIGSRLNLGGLQSELNARSVTASKLNNLDAAISSRASGSVWNSTRASYLDVLGKTPDRIAAFANSGISKVSKYRVKVNLPTSNSSLLYVSGRGYIDLCAVIVDSYAGSNSDSSFQMYFQLYIDGVDRTNLIQAPGSNSGFICFIGNAASAPYSSSQRMLYPAGIPVPFYSSFELRGYKTSTLFTPAAYISYALV